MTERPAPSQDDDWKHYRIGMKDCNYETISYICGLSDKSIVYLTESDTKLHADFDEKQVDEVEVAKSMIEEIPLEVKANSELLARYRENAFKFIGTSLFYALERGQKGDAPRYFSEAARYVDVKASEAARMQYILSAFVMTIVAAIPLLLRINVIFTTTSSSTDSFLLLIGASFGAIGSFLSVLQRFQKIKIEEHASNWFISIGGIARIVLGFVFGGAFVILQKAGLVLSAETNIFMFYSFAIVSGFSERFIPDLLRQKGNSQTDDTKQSENN